MQTHYYDEQIRRFLIQVIRLLSNFSVKYSDGTLYRTPVTYGDSSRQAAAIIRRNSENSIPSAPMISVYVTGLKYDRNRTQNPTFVDISSIRTRKYDTLTDSYINQQGNAYNVERIMPTPYELSIRADIWTSNSDQKFQLMEQILPLFNPSLEIQSTDNYLDWSSLTALELTGTTWSSRNIPQGTDDSIDIASLDFILPMWLSMPARVRKMGVIEKIINSIFDPSGDIADFVASDDLLLGTRQAVTFQNYGIWVNNGQIQLLKENPVNTTTTESEIDAQVVMGTTKSWPAALDKYGVIRNGISQLRLGFADQIDHEIVGTIAVHPTDDLILLYTVDVDTLPVNTLDPVDAIINPQAVAPGINGLPAAVTGQRYLLLKSIGNEDDSQEATGWYYGSTELVANTNDIIEYDGSKWIVSFNSAVNVNTQYVSNITTSKQYKYSGTRWTKSWEGEYLPLSWRLIL